MQRNHVDIFYFDGASNVQKAGDLLGVRFPRTVTHHGGEHVVALWFSDLVKIPVIKVCLTLFLLSCFDWFSTDLANLFSFQFFLQILLVSFRNSF